MTGDEFRYVEETVKNEGFDSAFVDYTDFVDEVSDDTFHELRLEYLEARRALREYAGIRD